MSNSTPQLQILTTAAQKVERLTRELYQVATSIECEEAAIATTHPIEILETSMYDINRLSRLAKLIPEPLTNDERELIAEINAIQSCANLIISLEKHRSYTMTFQTLWLGSTRALEIINLISNPTMEVA